MLLDRRVDRLADQRGHRDPAGGGDPAQARPGLHLQRDGGAIHDGMLSLVMAPTRGHCLPMKNMFHLAIGERAYVCVDRIRAMEGRVVG